MAKLVALRLFLIVTIVPWMVWTVVRRTALEVKGIPTYLRADLAEDLDDARRLWRGEV